MHLSRYSIHAFRFLRFGHHVSDFRLWDELGSDFFKFLSLAQILNQLLLVWRGFDCRADVRVYHLLGALFFAAFLWAAVFLGVLLFFNWTKLSLVTYFVVMMSLTRCLIFVTRVWRIIKHLKHRDEQINSLIIGVQRFRSPLFHWVFYHLASVVGPDWLLNLEVWGSLGAFLIRAFFFLTLNLFQFFFVPLNLHIQLISLLFMMLDIRFVVVRFILVEDQHLDIKSVLCTNLIAL